MTIELNIAIEATNLEDLTVAELLTIHNRLVVDEDRQLKSWKRAKDLLIERIREAQEVARMAQTLEDDATRLDVVADSEEGENAEDTTENLTIGSVVSQLVLNPLLSYDQIVDMIRSQFPGANTSRRSVASVAARLRKAGVIVPLRRKKGPNEA